MIVYRITLLKFSKSLVASGVEARWNSKDIEVIYTANSKALACLENLVHRSAKGLEEKFCVISIEIPDSLLVKKIEADNLKKRWSSFINQSYTRKIGDDWIASKETAILKVPSTIIPDEYNFILNPNHNSFKKIKIVDINSFSFDLRLKR